MMHLVLATTEASGGILNAVQDAWNQPAVRPVLIIAALCGLVLGCVLVPLCRRVWLAIKPRETMRSRD